MSRTWADQVMARQQYMRKLMAACVDKGEPVVLTTLSCDGQVSAVDAVVAAEWWVVAGVGSDNEETLRRAQLVVGDARRGPLWLERRLDIVPPRQNCGIMDNELIKLPVCKVILWGWRFTESEWQRQMR